MNYCIDTSTIIQFFRGYNETKNVVIALTKKGSFTISVITYGELLYGAHRSGNFEREEQKIFRFITDFSITILPITPDIIARYARVKYLLERKGVKLDEFDLLIGATAVASGSTLVTDNLRHFRRFPGIVLAGEEIVRA